ncbi:hypothetical protein BLD48_05860 [Exiguobacterium sp. KRL4]|uniref:hypothetical protein n=1 Tax=Exiguobacterium sp. KRL4 TaxID=1914536 RepID=UPI0008F88700|nr:hypothetical protein [Exiguobacterium sp. KRL4]OIN67412.1 hypothetical protein BLD48_05860 [Exiguobacterium sp. KRL4]
MRIIMNGTTITGSVSEVLATLTHLGFKASDTTAEVTAKSVTMGQVAGITVTDKGDAKSIVAQLFAGETVTPAIPVPAPKPARDGVIQQAISDVEDLLSRGYYGLDSKEDAVVQHVGDVVDFVIGGSSDRVDFFINTDKRTVIAKLYLETTTSVTAKEKAYATQGRAKCAPGDVFNEHIGKAIALRRALGLEVPVEYFTVEARDRDDLAVGDVVRGNLTGNFYELTESIDNQMPYRVGGIAPGYKGAGKVDWDTPYATTLINDSARHTAPDLEVSRIIRH